jgi:hypothetical protein
MHVNHPVRDQPPAPVLVGASRVRSDQQRDVRRQPLAALVVEVVVERPAERTEHRRRALRVIRPRLAGDKRDGFHHAPPLLVVRFVSSRLEADAGEVEVVDDRHALLLIPGMGELGGCRWVFVAAGSPGR